MKVAYFLVTIFVVLSVPKSHADVCTNGGATCNTLSGASKDEALLAKIKDLGLKISQEEGCERFEFESGPDLVRYVWTFGMTYSCPNTSAYQAVQVKIESTFWQRFGRSVFLHR